MTSDEERAEVIRRLSSAPQLTGTPSEQIVAMASYRDALGRAESTSNGDLPKLLERADATSDALQARAVFAEALRRDMGALVEVYVQAHPEVAADIQRLRELNAKSSPTRGAATKLRTSVMGGER